MNRSKTSWKHWLSISIFLFGMAGKGNAQDQSLLQLEKFDTFYVGNKAGIAAVWGAGKQFPFKYFDELLPSNFLRKIRFTSLELEGAELRWIFTGPKGGVTVVLKNDSISLVQRFYDSYGFIEDPDKPVLPIYPQKNFMVSAKKISQPVKSLTLTYSHDLRLNLLVNDSLAISQISQIDLSRYQLQLIGSDGKFSGKFSGEVFRPAEVPVNIGVDKNKKFQEIVGFGGTTSPVAYNLLSDEGKKMWWQYLGDYNLLLQREYPIGQKLKSDFSNWDDLKRASSHYYGDNFPNGEISDFKYNGTIVKKGGMVTFEFWNLPGWALDDPKNSYKPNYSKYAEAVVNYCKTSQEKGGYLPSIIGIQNEVQQPDSVWQRMTLQLRKSLDSAGFTRIKLHMANAPNLGVGIRALRAFQQQENVWRNIDFTASNLYDFQTYFTNPDKYDSVIDVWNHLNESKEPKPFYSIELCVNKPRYQTGSYKVASLMGELYHKNLVLLNASAINYCWLLVNTVQPSFAESRSLFTIDEKNNFVPAPSSYQLRIFGAFSRHLKAGFKRIQAVSGNKDLLVSAYSYGNKNCIILFNRGISPFQIRLPKDLQVSAQELCSPYLQNQKLSVSSNIIRIAPGTIVTLW